MGNKMKQLLVTSMMALAISSAYAQTSDSTSTSGSTSGANAGSMAIGGGAVSATIGGNTNRNTARGGAGGNGTGGAASSNVTVNLGSTSGDDPTSRAATPVANAQQAGTSQPSGTYKERIETVGSPGSMSYGVSFSQYNCANTAGVGAGFMGGAFQIGVGKESDPCNARANAAALFSIAQTLATANAQLSAQLYHAAILLIGNSTKETQAALSAAGVSDWAVASNVTPTPTIVPPAPTPTPPPADESKAVPSAVPAPAVAEQPLEDSGQTVEDVKKAMYPVPTPLSTAVAVK